MSLTVDREVLAGALDKADLVARTEKLEGEPVCGVNISENKMVLVSDGLGIRVKMELPVESDENIQVVIPISKVNGLVKLFTAKVVVMDFEEREENKTLLIKGDKSSYRIRCNKVDVPIPFLYGDVVTTIKSSEFLSALSGVSYASSDRNISKPQLSCVYIGIDNTLIVFLGGDGYRASRCVLSLDDDCGIKDYFLVPKSYIPVLSRLMGEGEVEIISSSKEEMGIKSGNTDVIMSVFAYEYPSNGISSIMDSLDGVIYCELETQHLINAVNRLSLVSSSQSPVTKITFLENSLMFSAESGDYGEGKEEVASVFSGNISRKSESVILGIMRIKDALAGIKQDKIRLAFGDRKSLIIPSCDKSERLVFDHFMVPIYGEQ